MVVNRHNTIRNKVIYERAAGILTRIVAVSEKRRELKSIGVDNQFDSTIRDPACRRVITLSWIV
jgi:hypothetical protein